MLLHSIAGKSLRKKFKLTHLQVKYRTLICSVWVTSQGKVGVCFIVIWGAQIRQEMSCDP